jgi:hypothetical protein
MMDDSRRRWINSWGPANPAPTARPQEIGPGLGGLAEPIGKSHEFLGAVGAHADHHQQAATRAPDDSYLVPKMRSPASPRPGRM